MGFLWDGMTWFTKMKNVFGRVVKSKIGLIKVWGWGGVRRGGYGGYQLSRREKSLNLVGSNNACEWGAGSGNGERGSRMLL